MKTKLSSKKSIYIFGTLMIMLLQIVIGTLLYSKANTNYVNLYSWIIIITFIWSLWSWLKVRKELFCPYTIFLMVMYVFMTGQCFFWALHVEILPFYDLRLAFSAENILKAQIYTCISLTSFHIGALIKANLNINRNDKIINKSTINAIKIVGWILFFVSIIPTVLVLKDMITIVLSSGYKAIYDQVSITGINKMSDDIAKYIIPSLICLLIGYSFEKSYKFYVLLAITTIYILILFFIGGRSSAVVLIITILCIWHYCIKEIRGPKVLVYGIFGYLLVSFLNAVSQLRSVIGRTLIDYFELTLSSLNKPELFINAISGMGWSMFPLIKTMELVPQYFTFRFGSSYLFSIFTIIPNLGFWDVHPSMKYCNLSTWLTNTINYPYGTGYSVVAETYINFSWLGPIFMFVIGALISWVFTKVTIRSWRNRPEIFVLIMVIFAMTVMTARNNFLNSIRAIFFYSIPVYLMIISIRKLKLSNK